MKLRDSQQQNKYATRLITPNPGSLLKITHPNFLHQPIIITVGVISQIQKPRKNKEQGYVGNLPGNDKNPSVGGSQSGAL